MRFFYKKFIIIFAGLAILSMPFFVSAATSSQLRQQAADANQKASDLAKQADYLNKQISNLDAQIADNQKALDQTIVQVNETQAKIEELKVEIKAAEDELAAENEKLNQIIAAWYMEGDDTSMTSAILSSNTLSEVVTKQEYYDSIKQQIDSTIEKINQLKADLNGQKAEQDAKKAELTKLQAQQEGYLRSSQYQKNTKATLLSGTNQQKQDYLQKAASLSAEAERVSAAEAAARRSSGDNTREGGTGGYPYAGYNVSGDPPDPWLFVIRQCTSYVAWYWNIKLGKGWFNTQPGRGSAKYWPEMVSANNQKYGTNYSVSSTPRVGAIISWQSGTYGHVAIVEKVYPGGNIDVSEYNWYQDDNDWGIYTYRTNISPSGSFSYIY